MADKTSLFSIQCDTCAARLTVRSESAIGQVLACPRCGSMVMVEPPENWIAPVSDPLPPLPRRPRDLNDSQATLSTEFESLGPEVVSTRPRPVPAQRKTHAPPVQQTTGGPILPDGNWDSSGAVARRKKFAWVAGIVGVCLIALAAIIWMIVSMTQGGETIQIANDDNTVPVSLDDAVAKSKEDPDPGIDPEPGSEPPVTDTEANTDDSNNSHSDDTDPEIDKTNLVDTTDTPPVAPVLPEDPLVDIDPSNDVASPGDAVSLDDTALQKTFMEEVGPLQELFTDPGVGATLGDFGESRQESLIGLGKIYVPRPKPMDLDFQKQLNEVFPEVRVDQVPLVEFVRMLNLISEIPIQLDTHSVLYSHLRPMEKLTYAGKEKSLVGMIDEALKELGLVAITDSENNMVTIAFKDNDVITERKFDLEPVLAADDAHRGKLIELIKTVTGPQRWEEGEIPPRIVFIDSEVTLESTGILYDEVRFLLDRLTVAARLNVNPDDVAAKEDVRSYWKKSLAVLETECQWNEIQLMPASQILNRVARDESLVALLDWHSLMPEGWNPDTLMPWPGHESTVDATLTDITSSMGLAWRMLGPAMVQITSQREYRNSPRYEVYPCAPVLKQYSIEQIMGILQTQLYSDVQKVESWTRVDYFPTSNCIVAKLPDPLLIRLETILDELAR